MTAHATAKHASSASSILSNMSAEFYLRYYVGHKGKFGHEFLEFEFRPDGKDLIQQLNTLRKNYH